MELSYRRAFVLICLLFLITRSQKLIAQTIKPGQQNVKIKSFSFPLQLEMRVPFGPTAFPSGSRKYLYYELYLTNFGPSPMNLRCIALIDANGKKADRFMSFDSTQLQSMLRHSSDMEADRADKLTLASGETVTVFMEVISDNKKPFPIKLIHRVITETDSLDGAIVSTQSTNLQSFAPPLQGTNWTAADGPSNNEDNHHRRGVLMLEGKAVNSRRYAIDWKKYKDSVSFSGDPRNVRSYYCYGEKVFAVADGRVIMAKDGLPNNIPGHGKDFHPAVPLTFETLSGNSITLDLGNGHFAYYMHLQPGSLLVKEGARVRKGQLLARIGASGDAREPHLHFEVTTSPKLLFGEGVPYLIDRYRSNFLKHKPANIHIFELPIDKEIVDFRVQSVK